jgi:hypothetical protein
VMSRLSPTTTLCTIELCRCPMPRPQSALINSVMLTTRNREIYHAIEKPDFSEPRRATSQGDSLPHQQRIQKIIYSRKSFSAKHRSCYLRKFCVSSSCGY